MKKHRLHEAVENYGAFLTVLVQSIDDNGPNELSNPFIKFLSAFTKDSRFTKIAKVATSETVRWYMALLNNEYTTVFNENGYTKYMYCADFWNGTAAKNYDEFCWMARVLGLLCVKKDENYKKAFIIITGDGKKFLPVGLDEQKNPNANTMYRYVALADKANNLSSKDEANIPYQSDKPSIKQIAKQKLLSGNKKAISSAIEDIKDITGIEKSSMLDGIAKEENPEVIKKILNVLK